MSQDPTSSFATRVARALARRCPRCGGPAFAGYFRLHEHCPRCGHRFEREEGYWVGALIINTAFTFLSFLVVFVGGILLFWPEVPWVGLGVVTVAVNAVLPIVFYPLSKTLWVALESSWHPPEPHEVDAARGRVPRTGA